MGTHYWLNSKGAGLSNIIGLKSHDCTCEASTLPISVMLSNFLDAFLLSMCTTLCSTSDLVLLSCCQTDALGFEGFGLHC